MLTSPTAANLVGASLAAKSAAPACSKTSNSGVLAVATNTPPSGYPSLKSIDDELAMWADQDNQQTIIDVGSVANSNGNSVSATSSLISDSQGADQLAQQIESQIGAAESQSGMSDHSGLGLPILGIHQQ